MFTAGFVGSVVSGITNVWITDLIGFGYVRPQYLPLLWDRH